MKAKQTERSHKERRTDTVHLYSVGQVCDRMNVTRKTLFYYDKIGLLEPTEREGAQKFKLYDSLQVQRLGQILNYRNAGLSISEIRMLLDNQNADHLKIMNAAMKRLISEKNQKEKEIMNLQVMIDLVLAAGENGHFGSSKNGQF